MIFFSNFLSLSCLANEGEYIKNLPRMRSFGGASGDNSGGVTTSKIKSASSWVVGSPMSLDLTDANSEMMRGEKFQALYRARSAGN